MLETKMGKLAKGISFRSFDSSTEGDVLRYNIQKKRCTVAIAPMTRQVYRSEHIRAPGYKRPCASNFHLKNITTNLPLVENLKFQYKKDFQDGQTIL